MDAPAAASDTPRRRLRRPGPLPWPVALAVIVLLHLLAAVFGSRLHLNNAPEAYYPKDSPAIVLRDSLRREFPGDEVLSVVFRGADLFEPAFLRQLDQFGQEVAREPLVDRVISITTMERIGGTSDGFEVGPLVDMAHLGSTEQTRQRVLADRFAPGLLVSRDGRYVAVAVRPKPLSESEQRQQLRDHVMAAMDRAGLRSHYVGDVGPVTVDVAQLQSVESDSALFVPLTVGAGIALLWWLVGSVRPMLFGVLAMSTVVGPTVGLVAALGAPYTMATAILPSLMSAYALATLMHLYAGMQRGQASGLDNPAAIRRTVDEALVPGLFNVLTTAAGLLSLMLVPIPPIQVFGIAGACGTVLVFFTVFVLLPPLLARFDPKPWPHRSSGMGRLGRLATRIAMFSLRRAGMVLGAGALLVAVTIPLALKVEVESDLLTYFRHDHPVNRDTDRFESRFVGVTTLEISLTGKGRDALQNVATLRAVRELQNWLERQSEVDRTLSMVDLVEEMNWAMQGEEAGQRKLPASDKLLRQYLLVYDGKDLYELVNRDFQRARLMVNLNVHGAREIGQSIDRIREYAKAHPIPGIELDIGGHGRLFADQADLLVGGQINSFAGAFGQIFLFMALLWRSFKQAAVAMVPNLAPLFFIFVLMGLTATHLDMATVMIASLVLGITVDDTIHLFHHYREHLRHGAGHLWAIARSFEAAGRAVLAISLLLTTQFALLGFSAFVPTANFGWLTAVGLVAGQLFELLLLPPLLLLSARVKLKPLQRRARPPVPAPTTRTLRTLPASRSALDAGASTAVDPDEDSTGFAPTLFYPRELPPEPERRALVCLGERCRAQGAAVVWKQANVVAERLDLKHAQPPAAVTKTGCLGRCEAAPVMQVYPEGVYCERVDPRLLEPLLRLQLLDSPRVARHPEHEAG